MFSEMSEKRRVKTPLEIYPSGDLLPYTLRGITQKFALLLGQCVHLQSIHQVLYQLESGHGNTPPWLFLIIKLSRQIRLAPGHPPAACGSPLEVMCRFRHRSTFCSHAPLHKSLSYRHFPGSHQIPCLQLLSRGHQLFFQWERLSDSVYS
jgi:hypothetical protein